MKKLFTLALLSALFTSSALAGDAALGEIISEPCAACHGATGAEPISNYPVLAGQYEEYLLHTLRAYKNGQRANAVMAAQVQNLSRQDLENLAAYFAEQSSDLD